MLPFRSFKRSWLRSRWILSKEAKLRRPVYSVCSQSTRRFSRSLEVRAYSETSVAVETRRLRSSSPVAGRMSAIEMFYQLTLPESVNSLILLEIPRLYDATQDTGESLRGEVESSHDTLQRRIGRRTTAADTG